uniref:receptor-type tyrosine-protein phosphatase C-like isoform X3 n=1 Tax=Scatophagus argus TaxID=75038 RepID=UPI001ED81C7C|nr:receptor-type tyrosine-protein phosphatase C-like isoform X3 [Scatophagus argus]
MAGCGGLKILLLWVGIVNHLTRCQSPETTQPSPANTSGSPTTTSTNQKSDSQSNSSQNQNSTPITNSSISQATTQAPPPPQSNQSSPANTSDSPTTTSTKQTPDSQSKSSQNQNSPPITNSSTSQATTQAPPPPQCDYTVTPVKFGFQIDITSSTNGTYTINIEEEGLTWKKYHEHQHSNQSSSLKIQHLKPCTEYKLGVTLIDNNGDETSCNHAGNKTKTIDMSQSDIEEVERCSPGYVCYRSDWNIMSSLSASNNNPAKSCMNDKKTLCIELKNNDFCSDLTVNFASGNCPSFSLTKSIRLDFLNPRIPTFQNKLPVKIKVDLPPNCNVTDDYTCVESGNPNKSKTPSELEPFTDYRCVGHIKDNVTVINTTAFNVKIDCDVTVTSVTKSVTNTSADWSWTTKSNNCPQIIQDISYSCSCDPKSVGTDHKSLGRPVVKHSTGGKCIISGLTPYTNYTCKVQPTYNRNDVKTPSKTQLETKAGIPDKPRNVALTVLDHNVIKVTCHNELFHGPREEYIARLHYDSDPENEIQKTRPKGKCDFEFRDLSYLTAYKVKVTTYNGELESEPVTEGVSTQYNSKALIGVMAFILISIIITLAVCLMCRKSRSDVTEDVMLETATYMNVPTRG